MSDRGRATYFLGLAQLDEHARLRDEELRRRYARPDALPLPEEPEPAPRPLRVAVVRRLLARAGA